ncbi:MAG TPA: SufD family Fe-S cluster assembly protein [Allosphingosinicella sp.]|nr:SufD family Fe-S cluster assembly protein [Allosphingosinicella sp.]
MILIPPLPSNKDEAWRWSDMAALQAAAQSPPRPLARDPEDLFLDIEGPRLLFVDGELDAERSRVGPVRQSPGEHRSGHPLAAAAAGRGSGWVAALGHGHEGLCIQIVHAGSGGESHLPAFLRLDEDIPASLVETFVGSGWANRSLRLELGRGARLMRSVRILQDEGFVSIRDEAEVGEGASLVSTFLAAGDGGTRIDGEIRLAGEGAYGEAGGALLARGRQRHDANFVVRHDRPSGTSRQLWRSVADGQSTCSVAARVEVARDAQKTDGEQSLKGLLLSRSATINAKPELEIFADDVKCAHGATVGELNRDALFYMASRGVPEVEAKALLTRAFVADALGRIGDEVVREAVERDVERWFGGRA